MENKKFIKQGALFATLAFGYIAAVATLLSKVVWTFVHIPGILMPIGMLLLLVISVTLLGFIIFAKPVMLYLDGQKRESMRLLLATIGFLVLIAALLYITAIALNHLYPLDYEYQISIG